MSGAQDPGGGGLPPSGPRRLPGGTSGSLSPALLVVLAVVVGGGAFWGLRIADDRGLVTLRSAVGYFDDAVALQNQRSYREAAALYERAIGQDPDMAEALFNLSLIRGMEEDAAGFARWLDEAIAATQRREDRLNLYGRSENRNLRARMLGVRASLAERSGDFAAAERDLTAALQSDFPTWVHLRWARLDRIIAEFPDATWITVPRYERAALRLASGDADGALEDFSEAIAKAERGVRMMHVLDTGFRAMGGGEPATSGNDGMLSARQVQTAQLRSLYQRARLLVSRGDDRAALADLDAALRLSPRDEAVLALRGEVAARVGIMPGR